MRIVTLILAPVILLACLATEAFGQETRASASAKFSREFAASDANKDGVLTRAEVQARLARMGAGNKKLDPTHAKRLADLWFGSADADKNGKVTEAEAQRLLAATFNRSDSNGDGRIGGDERAAAARGLKKGG